MQRSRLKKLAKSMVGQHYDIRTRERPSGSESPAEKSDQKRLRHRIKELVGSTSNFLQDQARVRETPPPLKSV